MVLPDIEQGVAATDVNVSTISLSQCEFDIEHYDDENNYNIYESSVRRQYERSSYKSGHNRNILKVPVLRSQK
jgi:hypothetical protein